MGVMPKVRGGPKVPVCLHDHTEFHSANPGGVKSQKAMREMRSLGGDVDGDPSPGHVWGLPALRDRAADSSRAGQSCREGRTKGHGEGVTRRQRNETGNLYPPTD